MGDEYEFSEDDVKDFLQQHSDDAGDEAISWLTAILNDATEADLDKLRGKVLDHLAEKREAYEPDDQQKDFA